MNDVVIVAFSIVLIAQAVVIFILINRIRFLHKGFYCLMMDMESTITYVKINESRMKHLKDECFENGFNFKTIEIKSHEV